MIPVKSTPEILLWKHLNESVDEKWKGWAYEMIKAGFDTEHLIELAGIIRPYNQFELQSLTTKVLDELGLEYANRGKVFDNYIGFIVNGTLEDKRDLMESLRILKELYLRLDDKRLQDFAMLYWAKADLEYDDVQHYWPEGDKSTMDKIILDYFTNWKNNRR